MKMLFYRKALGEYKKPYPPEMALGIIRNGRGEHFDPEITDLFIEYFDEFPYICESIGDSAEVDVTNFIISERNHALFSF